MIDSDVEGGSSGTGESTTFSIASTSVTIFGGSSVIGGGG